MKNRNLILYFIQGGVMTIWTAFHSKYKLGGFMPIVTWAPLRKIYDYPKSPVNRDTPILYLNGLFDPIVTPVIAVKKTKEVVDGKQFFFCWSLPPSKHYLILNGRSHSQKVVIHSYNNFSGQQWEEIDP